MPHFVMRCNGEYPTAALAMGPQLRDPPWFHGKRLSAQFLTPLVYTLDPERRGSVAVMYSGESYPVMRDDLVAALEAAGVDNLQLFRAVIRDPVTGVEYGNYKAFNIVGVVSAADMKISLLLGTSESRMIDVDFASLTLVAQAALVSHMFRLAESVNAIIVDDIVKREVERRAIPGMEFYEPEDWSG